MQTLACCYEIEGPGALHQPQYDEPTSAAGPFYLPSIGLPMEPSAETRGELLKIYFTLNLLQNIF